MDRRTLLAIILCFFIYLGWQKFYLEPRIPQESQTSTQQAHEGAAAPNQQVTEKSPGSTSAAPEREPQRPHETMTLATGTGDATVGDSSQFFTGWQLKNYKVSLDPGAPDVDLHAVTNESGEMELQFDDPSFAYLNNIQGKLHKTAEGVEWVYEDSKVKLTRLFKSNDKQNWVDTQITADFKTEKHPSYAFVSLGLPNVENDPESRDRQLIYFADNSVERTGPKKAKLKQVINPVHYIGAGSRYFLMSVINTAPVNATGLVQPLGENYARTSLVYPVAGKSISLPLRVYFGPKELDTLRSVDPKLDQTVDFGFFSVLGYPILKFLKWIYNLVGNYGVAIIILTVLLRVLIYPLTYKSMKSMNEMKKLQPQLTKIREKYKDDKETLNREMMGLMKTHGYNPLAGCAPMLLQLPVFWALYRVLYSSIDLYHAPFFGYLHDLSAKDPYYITPIALSVLMFFQQKLTPTPAADPTQQKMMQFMPLMFGAFMLALPAGLNLYMLASSVAGIAQQLILNKKLGQGGPGGGHAPALARAR